MLSASCTGLSCPSPYRSYGFGDATADIKSLQQALVNAGAKSWGDPVPVTGQMNDQTLGALWVAISKDLAKAQTLASSLSSDLGTVIGWIGDAMHGIDSAFGEIPGAASAGFNTENFIKHWSTIDSFLSGAAAVVSAAGYDQGWLDQTAAAIKSAHDKVSGWIASHAGLLAKLVAMFSGAGTTASKPKFPGGGKLSTTATALIKQAARAGELIWPVGSVSRWNKSRNVWVIYRPLKAGEHATRAPKPGSPGTIVTGTITPGPASGFGSAMYGAPTQLGAATPAPPDGYTWQANAANSAGTTQKGVETDVPFYKEWWFWAIVVGTVGGGGYVLWRRKKAAK